MAETLQKAVADFEGFGANPLNRPTRNNNPGDIEYGPFARKHGATKIEDTPPHVAPRFAYFPTIELGFKALRELILIHYNGMTVKQFVNKYAPSNENDTNAYISYICRACACTPDTIVDTLVGE